MAFSKVQAVSAASGWQGQVGLMAACIAAALAGCASSPPGGMPRLPPMQAPDRDGPPLNPPPDLALTPDPEPQVEPIRQGGPNKPYVVLGKAYEPVAADVVWKEQGVASWYGAKFHGRKTASGELFSMYGITAAHRTLPIPSYARVRNLKNGKEIVVRVNDRGPFHSSRVMDLSYAAAVKLGISTAGSAQVAIERLTFDDIRTGAWRKLPDATFMASTPAADTLGEDPIALIAAKAATLPDVKPLYGTDDRSRAYTPAAQGYWVQLAAVSRRDGVDRMQQRVTADVAEIAPMMAVFQESAVFKLQVGPYRSREEALSVAQQAKEALQITPLVIERR